ncbi:MAG: diguanylate cyclase domain-containing protein [Leptospirales bacterium]
MGKKTNWWFPLAEGAAGILLVGGLFWGYTGTGSLIHARFQPFEIVVLLVAGRYGFVYGTSTAIFAFLAYYAVLLYRDGFSSFFPEEFSFLWPSVFLFSGMVIGDLRDDEHQKLADKERQLELEREQSRNSVIQISILETALSELEKRFLLQPETVSTLYDVARSINIADMNNLPHAILSGIQRFAKIETASLYKRTRNHWELHESLGTFPRRSEVPLKDGNFGRALSSGKLIILQDLFDHPNASPEERVHENEFPAPIITLPIRASHQEVLWIIAIESIPFLRITPETLRMLEIIGDWAGTQLAMLEEREATRKKIPVDPVTGLSQKAFFLERTKEELQKARRYKLPLSLLEIDFIPTDPLGHLLLGQTYLANLKEIIPMITRDTDVKGTSDTGRTLWLLLTVTDQEGAKIVGERFRKLYLERKAENPLEQVEIETRIITYSPKEEADRDSMFRSFTERLSSLGSEDVS